MNDTLAPVRSPAVHEHVLAAAATDAAHLTFVNRLELRLGLWLLLRSARNRRLSRDHEQHARRLSNARLLAERERVALRDYVLRSVRS